MNDIDTIREALPSGGSCRCGVCERARQAHAALDRIAANWLDLSALPKHYELITLHHYANGRWMADIRSVRWHIQPNIEAEGDTPAAAFSTACARAREAG